MQQKQGVEVLAAAFTDHFALLLRISVATPIPAHRRGCWRMNTFILGDAGFTHSLQTHWRNWQAHKKFYPKSVLWWERYFKQQLLITRVGMERRRDRVALEIFYYETIYNIVQMPTMLKKLLPSNTSRRKSHVFTIMST
jgi:hypothetical protein